MAGLLQGLDPEERLGGRRVAQLRGVGKAAVSAAGDDCLEGIQAGGDRAYHAFRDARRGTPAARVSPAVFPLPISHRDRIMLCGV